MRTALMRLVAANKDVPIDHGRAVVLFVLDLLMLALVGGAAYLAVRHPRLFPTDRLRGDREPRGPRTVLVIRGLLIALGLFVTVLLVILLVIVIPKI